MAKSKVTDDTPLKYAFEADTLVGLANQLSLDDMAHLINMFGGNIDIYLGTAGKRCVSTEVEWAGTNGHCIQITTKSAELDNLKDWDWLVEGLKQDRWTKKDIPESDPESDDDWPEIQPGFELGSVKND